MYHRCVGFTFLLALLATCPSVTTAGEREKVLITSTLDGTPQPSYVILPDGFDPMGKPVPLLVSLHSWSTDVELRQKDVERAAEKRGWIYLYPNFRGPNESPDACGSLKAQQDILDAVDWAVKNHPIDTRRVYLTGSSGGGHMAMLMAGRHPERWAGVGAWVGISDLAAWHQRHEKAKYGEMLRKSYGGPPGSSAAVDAEYRARSPLTWLHQATNVPLDLAAGVHDGHKGSVPVRHTLDAFNAVAKAQKAEAISQEEIDELSRPNGRLDRPRSSDTAEDREFGRAIYLRRTAGQARVTIFEGGHEGLAEAAAAWLSRQETAEP